MTAIVFFVVGGGAAILYFGGLWWTVRQLARHQHPERLYLLSLVARLLAILTLIGCVAWLAEPIALGGFLLGFLITRLLVVRVLASEQTSARSL